MKNYARIAEVCHEANRAYCLAMGDESHLPWADCPDWQRETAIKGVMFKESKPESTAADVHNSWLMEKQDNGWLYGEVKDPVAKRHPCMVSYDELPIEQRAKDHIFQAIAGTILRHCDDELEYFKREVLRDDDRYPIATPDRVQHG